MEIIKVNNLQKNFGENQVLKGLSFTINKGEIFALLGHNGAGKTTTLRIILGLLDIDGGEVEVFQTNPFKSQEEVRKRCGVLLESNGLYESLTVYENLKFFAEAYKCFDENFDKKIDVLLERFEILDKKHSVIKDFSLGMKKKVAIIRTLFHEPEIVLLDEPTNGLDPISVNTFKEIMEEMVEKNQTTFILTTHNLDIVSNVCDRVVIVKGGKNVFDRNIKDSSSELIKTDIHYINGDEKSIKSVYKDFLVFLKEIGEKEISINIDEKESLISIGTKDKELVANFVYLLALSKILPYSINLDAFDLNKIYARTEMDGE